MPIRFIVPVLRSRSVCDVLAKERRHHCYIYTRLYPTIVYGGRVVL